MASGQTVEDAVTRSNFDEVWDVLQSLQEQDEVLADLIRYAAERKGRRKGFDDAGFADRIDFGGPALALESLRHAVAARCVENLYVAWDVWLGKLKSFKKRFGHCNVETGWTEDSGLASWVSAQRNRRNNGALSDEQIARLDQLGFVWDYQKAKAQETWRKWYRELEAYALEHGNPHVPRTFQNTQLANWVWIQRQRKIGSYKRNRGAQGLTPEQVRLLDDLGFRWAAAREKKWMENFDKLKNFKDKHGHTEVALEKPIDQDLADWVKRIRDPRRQTEERKALLDGIGFNWHSAVGDRKWQRMYAELRQYKTEHGSADIPSRCKNPPKLASWVMRQRERRKKGAISEDEIHLLDELGFTWKSRDVGRWEDRLEEVARFKAKHGHCNIPLKYPENPKLGHFVNNMRSQRNSGKLSRDRIAKLERHWSSVGIKPKGGDADWYGNSKLCLENPF